MYFEPLILFGPTISLHYQLRSWSELNKGLNACGDWRDNKCWFLFSNCIQEWNSSKLVLEPTLYLISLSLFIRAIGNFHEIAFIISISAFTKHSQLEVQTWFPLSFSCIKKKKLLMQQEQYRNAINRPKRNITIDVCLQTILKPGMGKAWHELVCPWLQQVGSYGT